MNKETIQDVSTCPDEKELTLQYLRSMQDDYIEGEGYERHPLPEWYALEYAINALEQEPCEDCISRKAVMRLIKNKPYDWSNLTERHNMLMEIRKLPSVNPQNTDVLDEIRAEIEDKSYLSYDDNPRHIIDESWVLEIIDKYRAADKYGR